MQQIDLLKSKLIPISFLDENDARRQSNSQKGWSFSYVYHFSELKDIYLVLKNTKFRKPKDIFNKKKELGLKYQKTPWEERRILEQINALKNFGLVGDNNTITKNVFDNQTIGAPLRESDLDVFKNIYFSYFRFREIHSWFTEIASKDRLEAIKEVTNSNIISTSNVLFPFSLESRFTNSFLTGIINNPDIFFIEKKREDLMRFWDVYIKWGQSLNLLEKFNLKELDIHFSANVKSLACVYFKNRNTQYFNLYDFLKQEYQAKYIGIPQLIFKIAVQYKFSIEDIKKIIVEQSLKNSELISLQRTSEIFIREKGKILFPKYKDSYISHLLLQY